MSADAPAVFAPLAAPSAASAPESTTASSSASSARRRRSARSRWLLVCLGVDTATLGGAAVASMIGARAGGLAWSFSPWTIVFCVLTVGLFQNRRLYQLRIRIPVLDDTRRIVVALTVAAALVLSVRLVLSPAVPSADIVRTWLFAVVYVTAGRLALYWSQAKARVARENTRRTLIVGTGVVGRLLVRRLLAEQALGLEPVGFVDPAPAVDEAELELPFLGNGGDIGATVARYGIEHLVVTFSGATDEELLELLEEAERAGASVSIVPRLCEKLPECLTVEHLGGLALLTPHATDPRGLSVAVKYGFDRVAAVLFLLLAAPLLAAGALAVYFSMGRPILFRQIRIGRDGQRFGILKFRSMKLPTADELEAQARAIAEELPGGVEGVDRRTRVGTFLRKTSLDELPQLFNVLFGEMSIVGPRPERPEFVSKFERTIYRYGDRHRVKSGITGWAQVHGLRGKTSIEDRAEWDNWYVENCSLWLDLKILVLTAGAVLRAFADVE